MDTATIRELNTRELRSFGLSTGAIVGVLFGGLIPWLWGLSYPLWPWVILAVMGMLALIAPKSLRPVYRLWMRIGLLISKVTTPIIIGIIFAFIIIPVGLVMRIFGWDPLDRQFDANIETYRKEPDSQSTGALERPY